METLGFDSGWYFSNIAHLIINFMIYIVLLISYKVKNWELKKMLKPVEDMQILKY